MARGGDTGKAHPIFRVAAAKMRPPAKHTSSGRRFKLRRGNPREFVAQPRRREISRAGDRAGEAARVIAGSDRPGVLAGVERGLDPDRRRAQPEHIGDDLGRDGSVPLALRQQSMMTETPPSGSNATVAAACAPSLGPARSPLRGAQDGGDVAHIGDRGFDHRGIADAIEAGPRPAPRRGAGAIRASPPRLDRAIDARRGNRRNRAPPRPGSDRENNRPGCAGSPRADRGRASPRCAASAVRARNRPAARQSRAPARSASCWSARRGCGCAGFASGRRRSCCRACGRASPARARADRRRNLRAGPIRAR